MQTSELSTIAQLLCFEELPVNFAKLVGELDTVLDRLRGMPHKVTWDCDDVVTFDLPGTRILLGWSEKPGRGLCGILTLSVGPSPVRRVQGANPEHSILCSRLVERVQQQVHAPNILWHQINCHMTAEWVDLLIEAIPDFPEFAQNPSDIFEEKATSKGPARKGASTARQRDPMAGQTAANSQPDLPRRPNDADLSRVREALYGEEDKSISVPMRLAVHAMNATLIVVWMPLGVTVMAQSIIRGEDMRLASRMMVMAGSIVALGQSSLGQQVAALGFF